MPKAETRWTACPSSWTDERRSMNDYSPPRMSAAFLLLHHRSTPNAPRPLAKSTFCCKTSTVFSQRRRNSTRKPLSRGPPFGPLCHFGSITLLGHSAREKRRVNSFAIRPIVNPRPLFAGMLVPDRLLPQPPVRLPMLAPRIQRPYVPLVSRRLKSLCLQATA